MCFINDCDKYFNERIEKVDTPKRLEGKLHLTCCFFIKKDKLSDYQVLKKARTKGVIYNAAPVRPGCP